MTDADIVTSLDNGQTKSVNLGTSLPMLLLAPIEPAKMCTWMKKTHFTAVCEEHILKPL